MRDTIVLGAGFQGACAALALAERGHRVTLIDRASTCLTRASLCNEGKIHLGFVYANDTTCRTSSLMLEAALAFGPLLAAWTGTPINWASFAAAPFTYLILRDSLVPADRVLDAWTRLEAKYEDAFRRDRVSYLGTTPDRLWWDTGSTARSDSLFNHDRLACAVGTAELALDTRAFRAVVSAALGARSNIRCEFGHEVRSVQRTATGFRVEGTTAEGITWRRESSTVVNCLWEGRLAIDRQLGLLPRRPWVYRLKYRVLGRLPASLTALPSLTLMLGRFGDVVNYGDGRVYVSWYPACLRGWSSGVTVPDHWDRACRGDATPAEMHEIASQSLEALDTIVPGFRQCDIDSVAAGVIFSWGDTDIDDPASELHRRDAIGPEPHDGYISVNTGKFTTAPLFARRIVELLH